MPTSTELPRFIAGFTAAGAPALRKAQKTFADWQLLPGATLDASLTEPQALAADYLAKLKYPEHLFSQLPKDAQDRVAVAVGAVAKKQWKPAQPVPPGTPSYKRPSWEADVYKVLFVRVKPAPPALRPVAPAEAPARWPELESLTRWKKAARGDALAKVLAKRLGDDWEALPASAGLSLPRVRSKRLELAFVAVPGGKLAMGVSAAELRALKAFAKPFGPEAAMSVKEASAQASPAHAVTVTPFLCAETPLLERHVKRLGASGDAANPHRVLRMDSQSAAALVTKLGLRLPSEAEWEWLAREGRTRAWLSGDEEPSTWTRAALGASLEDTAQAFGVVGLGWGEWVDDGWHPSYAKAPKTSAAWEPKTRPELARGGGLALWPWQLGGEALLLHAALRQRTSAAQAVRLVVALPKR